MGLDIRGYYGVKLVGIRAEMGRKGMRPSDLARTTGMSKQKISRMISKEGATSSTSGALGNTKKAGHFND